MEEKELTNGLDQNALEQLKSEFSERAPDFIDFEQTSGLYYTRERAYKDEIIEAFRKAISQEDNPADLGRVLYTLACPQDGPLLRWQTRQEIEKNHTELEDRFYTALGSLGANVRQLGPPAIWQASEELQALREAGATKLTHGEIWSIVFTIAGCAAPQHSTPFKINLARAFSEQLMGARLFSGKAPNQDHMKRWLTLLETLKTIMRDAWEWKPRDLVDVQGFLWMLRDKDLSPDAATKEYKASPANKSANSKPKNLVLYGPPGTGKTWSTAKEAVILCDGIAPGSRKEVLERYQTLVAAGQIEFVTFHQSYSYEEFVEGLRPTTGDPESGHASQAGFSLQPTNGVFRDICAAAQIARNKGSGTEPFDLTGRRVFKMSLGRAGVEEDIYEQCVESNLVALGYGGAIDWSAEKYLDFQQVVARWREDEPEASGMTGDTVQTWRFREMSIGDLVVVSEGNRKFRAIGEIVSDYLHRANPELRYAHQRRVKWLLQLDESLPADRIYRKNLTQASCYQMKDSELKKEALSQLLSSKSDDGNRGTDQFVLVIDEINRANISKVLGELITLIEPDKRLGQPNALSLRLPYSGDLFGVPDNLHILATMNTADRSIALLDTALRRRFTFKELMPDPRLLDKASDACGIDLTELLTQLNDRIEYLFDREHQIGHAYFMNCESRQDVDQVIREKIIPLLSEYFYDDWDRIAQVLGDHQAKRFLRRIELPPPEGLEAQEDARWRWKIRESFSDDAYEAYS
jgi:DNA polymerase III delta prime subunit